MKCVKNNKTGEITRVEDIRASNLVDAKTHSYANKADWKKGKSKEQRIAEAPVKAEKVEKKNKGYKSKKGKARKEAEATSETPAPASKE